MVILTLPAGGSKGAGAPVEEGRMLKTHQREIKIFPRVIMCHDQDWAVTAGQEEGVTQVSRRSLDTAGR